MVISFSKDRFGANQSAPMAGSSISVILSTHNKGPWGLAEEEPVNVRLAGDEKGQKSLIGQY